MSVLITIFCAWMASVIIRAYRDYQEKIQRGSERIDNLEKEQTRQAEILDKHEKRIVNLENKVRKLERDIESQKALIGDYYGQLDWLMLQQSGTVPGGKEFSKWQDKIVVKSNQLRRAENKLEDMKDQRRTAQRELAA